MDIDTMALNDFSKMMSEIILPEIMNLADYHGYDRNSMVKYTADVLSAMYEVSDFTNYQVDDEEIEG